MALAIIQRARPVGSWSLPHLQQLQIHRLAHRLVAGVVRVQVVAGIELGPICLASRHRGRPSKSITPSKAPLVRTRSLMACRFAFLASRCSSRRS